MRVLGLIPARGGSKSVLRKNIRMLNGKPLLQYTAEASLAARCLSQVILSTDDVEIAEAGCRYGLEVPFLRPPHLAMDETPMLPVVQHALLWMEQQGEYFDAVCLLQPTTPLRQAHEIDACVELLEHSEADSVVTVLPVPAKYNPHWVYFQDDKNLLHLSTGDDNPISRRQALPAAFHREGSVYVTWRDVIIEENSLYGTRLAGYLVDPKNSVNIDNLEDWEQAEGMLSAAGTHSSHSATHAETGEQTGNHSIPLEHQTAPSIKA